MECVECVLCFFRQADEFSSFDRFHDDDRLSVFPADVIAGFALYFFIKIVCIVELELYDFQLRVICENAIQYFGAVVEGDSDVADFSFFF